MKVFLDSNVLVSSFTANGVSRKLVDLLVSAHEVAISPQVIEESKRTISTKFVVDKSDLEDFFQALVSVATVVLPPFEEHFVRDPDDVGILGAAVKSKAEVLVSGDKDLLEITNPPIRILRPRELFELLEGATS